MKSLYNSSYADKYENNKYIWEREDDKNSDIAKKAHQENEEIRNKFGICVDTQNYEDFKTGRANTSKFYEDAQDVSPDTSYKAESDRLYNLINNFQYDPESDAAFKSYRSNARRESDSAQKSTMANLAKLSGGRNSSYASSAVAQVGQTYAQKISNYARELAEKAYNKLVEQYKLSRDRENDDNDNAQDLFDRLMKLGGADAKSKRNALYDKRETEEHNQKMLEDAIDYDNKLLTHDMNLDKYKAQLIKNNILNEKNMYDYNRWVEDPNYEIKDKKLAEAIGEYMSYSWLKENGPDYLYSKLYKK